MQTTNSFQGGTWLLLVTKQKYPSFKHQKSTLLLLQKETPALPTAEMHQRVPTSPSALSAPNPTLSHTGRSEFKHHLTYMPEKISPSSTLSTMKPQPLSLFLPTVRKSSDRRVTTINTGIGGNAQKKPAPRSTSSFRRSVEHAMGDNWTAPTTNSVSIKQWCYISNRKVEH